MQRKILLVLAVLSATLIIGVQTASAYWYIAYGQAKHVTKEYAISSCERYSGCESYAVGGCYREATSRFGCEMALFYPDEKDEAEIVCTKTLHWGVSYGEIVLKRISNIHCFAAA